MKADLKQLRDLGAALALVPEIPGHLASTVVRLTTVKDKLQAELTGLISVCGTVKVEEPAAGEWCIDRRLFLPFLKVGKEQWLTWTAQAGTDQGDEIVAKAGRRQAKFSHVASSGYDTPKWDGDELSKAEMTAVSEAVRFAPKNNTIPELNGVCFSFEDGISEVYSANDRVSYRQRLKGEVPNVKIPLEIAKLFEDGVAVRVTESLVTIKRPVAETCFIWQTVNERLAKFPVQTLSRLLDAEGKKLGTMEGPALADAAERLVAYLANTDKNLWTIEIIPGDAEKLTLRVSFPGAEFKETVPGTISTAVKLPLEEFASAASLVGKTATLDDLGSIRFTSGNRQWLFAQAAK